MMTLVKSVKREGESKTPKIAKKSFTYPDIFIFGTFK